MSRSPAEFILQWNTRSLISHWGEFKHYILSNNPLAAAIQETKFIDKDFNKYTWKIPGYSLYSNNATALPREGGTMLLVSNNLLHHQINLDTDIDAVAVNVKLANREITLISIYFTPNKEIDFDSFTALLDNFNTPCLIMGDFNARHRTWGCNNTTTRGESMLDFIDRHNLVYLNNQTPTYICIRQGQVSYSVLDLTLASPSISSIFTSNVETDPLFSDHYPIRIELGVPSGQTDFNFLPRWKLNKADWASFSKHIDERFPANAEPDVTTFLNTLLESAHKHIPHTAPRTGRRASPWWNTECQKAVAIRKRAFKQFQKCICEAHENEVRRTSKLANEIIRETKRKSWQSFAGEFNRFTPLSKIWSNLKALSLKRPPLYKIPHLKVNNVSYSLPLEVATEFAKHFAKISSETQYQTSLVEKLNDEFLTLSFASNNTEPYNQPITKHELALAISKCGKTSVGPDQIDTPFLKISRI